MNKVNNLKKLVVIANKLDQLGLFEEVATVEKVIEHYANAETLATEDLELQNSDPETSDIDPTKTKPNISTTEEIRTIGNNDIVVNTFSADGGKIVVFEKSPFAGGANSIYDFLVDEDSRGQGIGSKLLDAVIQAYPGEEISAQVSSEASLKVFFNKGFKSSQGSDASWEETLQTFHNDGGSLNMRLR